MSETPPPDAVPGPADEPLPTELPPADPLFGDPAPASAGPTRTGSGWVTWAVAAGVVGVVVAGGIFLLGRGEESTAANDQVLAQAFGPGAPGGGTNGTITTIDGDVLTVESQGFAGPYGASGTTGTSSVSVQTDADTVVTASVEGSLDDLAEGDQVIVIGETADDGTVAATSVAEAGDVGDVGDVGVPGSGQDGLPGGQAPPDGAGYGQPPTGQFPGAPGDGSTSGAGTPPQGGAFAGGAPTFGTITAVDADGLTLETADGSTVTVTTSADTTVTVSQELTVADLEVGDQVQVQGDGSSSDPVVATSIRVGDGGFAGFGGPPTGAVGTTATTEAA